MNHFRLATRLYNCPLLVTQAKAAEIERVFRAHEEGRAALLSPAPEAVQRVELAAPGMVRTDAGYWRTAQGVALIPVIGTLVQRGDSLDAASGLVGYNRIAGQLQAALDDPRVDAIMLEIDSNGGEAAGVIDLAEKIRSAGTKKPVWTIANEQAFSAGYWLASAGTKLFVPQTGMVGSVGVVMLHVDQSQRDAKSGLVYTPIFAGARKVDFSSHAPLSDEAMAIAQEEVNRVYDLFVKSVADQRRIDEQAVRDTQAGLLNPEAAVKAGFVDGVQSFDETLTALAAEAQHVRIHGMRAAASARAAAPATPDPSLSKGELEMTDAERAAQAAQVAEARAAGVTEGKAASAAEAATAVTAAQDAERARISAILTHAEAEGRAKLANHLAFKTAHSVDDAVALLAAADKAAPAAPGNPLAEAMAGIPNPKVGAGSAGDAEAKPVVIDSKAIFARASGQANRAR
jgi:signal peptide peptidase SppA